MIYALGFIYSLPRFFEYKTEIRREKLIEIINETEYVEHLVIVNNFLRNRVYHWIVHLSKKTNEEFLFFLNLIWILSALYSFFQSILPLLLLSYFNVELIRNVQASSDFVKRFTSLNDVNVRSARERDVSRTREGSITRSVICLIGLFTLCQVPASILHYIHMYYRHHPALYICYDISNFLILLNSGVRSWIWTNDFIYFLCLFSGEFLYFHVLQSKVSSRTQKYLLPFEFIFRFVFIKLGTNSIATTEFLHQQKLDQYEKVSCNSIDENSSLLINRRKTHLLSLDNDETNIGWF